MNIYDHMVETASGENQSLAEFKGKGVKAITAKVRNKNILLPGSSGRFFSSLVRTMQDACTDA